MRCYNAAMPTSVNIFDWVIIAMAVILFLPLTFDRSATSKPFQFSMRQMFLAIMWLCIAARLWTLYLPMRHAQITGSSMWLLVLLYLGSFIAAGTGVGTIMRKPFDGAGWGAILAFVGAVLWFIAGR